VKFGQGSDCALSDANHQCTNKSERLAISLHGIAFAIVSLPTNPVASSIRRDPQHSTNDVSWISTFGSHFAQTGNIRNHQPTD
jgi:hypothetical protein